MKLINLIGILALFGWPCLMFSQFTLNQSTDIDVSDFRGPLPNAWAGGTNTAQWGNIDLNIDGIPDLLVFDRQGDRILPFLYDSTGSSTSWNYSPEFSSHFPALEYWMLLRDFNGDGYADIFTSRENAIVVFQNVSQDSGYLAFVPFEGGSFLSFSLPGDDSSQTIKVLDVDIPSVSDLDQDGDLDILTFDLPGTLIEYHKNISQETFGHSDSLMFELEESCWGHVEEDAATNSVTLNVFCKGNVHSGGGLHSGSTLLTMDMDDDGDQELALGDFNFNTMVLLTNGGTATHAEISDQTNIFPSSFPVDLAKFPAAFLVDVNNDQVNDLIVSPNSRNGSENAQGNYLYSNFGTETLPDFQYQQNDFLQNSMLEFGSRAVPVLVDYDQDSLLDLVVSNYGVFQGSSGLDQFQTSISLYKNYGNANQPRFELITDDLASLSSNGSYLIQAHPAFSDLDQDGDIDMVVSRIDGKLDYYENISSSPNTLFPIFDLTTSALSNISGGNSITPFFFDVNADSKDDLLMGEQNGRIRYYENTSTPGSLVFTEVSSSFGQVDVSGGIPGQGASVPYMYRENGILHLFAGAENGRIFHYHAAPADPDAAFPVMDTFFQDIDAGTHAAPAFGDLNGDEIVDLIIGNFSGGLQLYTGSGGPISTSISSSIPSPKLKIFPNPAQDIICIESNSILTGVDFYLPDGTLIESREGPFDQNCLPVDDLPSGFYLLGIRHFYYPVVYRKLLLFR